MGAKKQFTITDLMSTAQVANIRGVSTETIRRDIESGRLKTVGKWRNRNYIITRADFEEYVAQNTKTVENG